MEEKRSTFLEGREVRLRSVERGDLIHFCRWMNDPKVNQFLVNFLPMTMPEEEQWFSDLARHKPNEMVLSIETIDGQLIGNIALIHINWRDRTAITGTVIGEPDYWGKGYGSEAKILLLRYAFEAMNLRKICSQAISFNERSIAYSKKCGYHEEGTFKDHVFRNGRYWDLINLAIFRSDFEPIWKKYQEK